MFQFFITSVRCSGTPNSVASFRIITAIAVSEILSRFVLAVYRADKGKLYGKKLLQWHQHFPVRGVQRPE